MILISFCSVHKSEYWGLTISFLFRFLVILLEFPVLADADLSLQAFKAQINSTDVSETLYHRVENDFTVN